MDALPPHLVAFALQVQIAFEAALSELASFARLFAIAAPVLAVFFLAVLIWISRQEKEPARKTPKQAGYAAVPGRFMVS